MSDEDSDSSADVRHADTPLPLHSNRAMLTLPSVEHQVRPFIALCGIFHLNLIATRTARSEVQLIPFTARCAPSLAYS